MFLYFLHRQFSQILIELTQVVVIFPKSNLLVLLLYLLFRLYLLFCFLVLPYLLPPLFVWHTMIMMVMHLLDHYLFAFLGRWISLLFKAWCYRACWLHHFSLVGILLMRPLRTSINNCPLFFRLQSLWGILPTISTVQLVTICQDYLFIDGFVRMLLDFRLRQRIVG